MVRTNGTAPLLVLSSVLWAGHIMCGVPAPLNAVGKLRILVDKVMQPEEGWVTKRWMVKEAAAAGFNVFVPRRGYDRLEEVARVATWCEQAGMWCMPWMRGSLPAPQGARAEGKRLVWENGVEQPLWSPTSGELWQYLTRYIVAYARLSTEKKGLVGVCIDFENYAPARQANCYSVSYDMATLRKFAQSQGKTIPDLPPAQRKPYLEKHGLHEAFCDFQYTLWQQRCKELREAVDRYNPSFLFWVYPAPGTPFIQKAVYRWWASRGAPLLLADAVTYGRPSRFIPQQEALRRNQQRLLKRRVIAAKQCRNFLYLGGIDPAVRGADPEFSGRNALMIAGACDGYWVFYEGVTYRGAHRSYLKWFQWANEAIREGRFQEAFGARLTPEVFFEDVFSRYRGPVPVGMLSTLQGALSHPLCKLRRENLLVLYVKQSQQVRLSLRDIPVGRYRSPLGYEIRDHGGRTLCSGKVEHGGRAQVLFDSPASGTLLAALSAGGCAYCVEGSNVPVGLFAGGEGLSLIHGARRLFFHVPSDVRRFSVRIETRGSETARLRLFDPSGAERAAGETTPARERLLLTVTPRKGEAGLWSLSVEKASVGVLEDAVLRLQKPLLPFLFLCEGKPARR